MEPISAEANNIKLLPEHETLFHLCDF